MKQFWGLTLMILMIASNCFAMTFSQPVEIGVIGHMNLGGFTFKNVTENNGIEINDTRSRGHFKRFSQGVARFGNGQEALFFHYKNGTLEKKIRR